MKNPKVFFLSLAALFFMVLTFTVHWWFIAIAAVLSWLGWKELFTKKT